MSAEDDHRNAPTYQPPRHRRVRSRRFERQPDDPPEHSFPPNCVLGSPSGRIAEGFRRNVLVNSRSTSRPPLYSRQGHATLRNGLILEGEGTWLKNQAEKPRAKKLDGRRPKCSAMTELVRTQNRQPGHRSPSAPTKVVENPAVAAKSSRGTSGVCCCPTDVTFMGLSLDADRWRRTRLLS
jgi:hypothetical protein